MFEQQTPHRLVKHELLTDSAACRRMARRPRRRDHLRDRLRGHPTRHLRRRRLRAGLRPVRREGRRPQLHPPALPGRQHGGAEEQGPHHRRAEGNGVPPGRQRRRRLRRPEEARPQGARRRGEERRHLERGGDARLRLQRVGGMKPSFAASSARSCRQGALLRSCPPSAADGPPRLYFAAQGTLPSRSGTAATVFGSKAPAHPARGVGCPIPGSKGGGLGEARPGGHGGNRTPGSPGTHRP